MAFATPLQLANHLRTATSDEAAQGSPDVLDTARALQALDSATGTIQDECHWHIAPAATVTSRLRVTSSTLHLPTMHLTAVSSLSVAGSQPLVADRDFGWDETGRVELWWQIVGWRSTYATITYTHGWDTAPAGIVAVCLERAATMYDNPYGYLSETADTVTTVYGRALTDLDYRLAPYRLPVTA